MSAITQIDQSKITLIGDNIMSPAQWENLFSTWASPPGKTETDRCENAVSAIRKALDSSKALASRPTRVFVQGSYRNRTNVRADSDVDIGIVYEGGTFFADYPEGKTRDDYGNSAGTYDYSDFKNEVGKALIAYFGEDAVTRGNKAFDISENTYRVEADVAAFFEHRRYTKSGEHSSGVELRTDRGNDRIINWPEQHYNNGVSKNTDTARRYKSIVRILKTLRNRMADEGYESADPLIGFFLECLVWNAPNGIFGSGSLYDDVKNAIIYIHKNTSNPPECNEWGEVSELKYLFRGDRTAAQATRFLEDAWKYVGF